MTTPAELLNFVVIFIKIFLKITKIPHKATAKQAKKDELESISVNNLNSHINYHVKSKIKWQSKVAAQSTHRSMRLTLVILF